jgi:all-trans-8'-apo-beta-carotenal 15,15'-oxygenase
MSLEAKPEIARANPSPRNRLDWRLGFVTYEDEHPAPVALDVVGHLPAELTGTLYRIGPARFDVHGERYGHWFDGDGMIHALTLDGGRARYVNRFVDTAGKRDEDRAKKRIYGGFGTRPAGGPLTRFRNRYAKNAANTSIVLHGQSLYALFEAGRPHRIDPVTLETRGEDDLSGTLGPRAAYSAHPKTDAAGGLVNFGVEYGKKTILHVYRTDAGGVTRVVADLPLPFAAIVHDFAVTATKAVFVVAPVTLPALPLGVLTGQASYHDSLAWRPELMTRVAVMDLSSGETRWFTTAPFMLFHTVSAWEEGDDIVVDVCAYDDATVLRSLGEVLGQGTPTRAPAYLRRLRISQRTGAIAATQHRETSLEFPRVTRDGGPYGRVWGVAWPDGAPFLGAPVAFDPASRKVARAHLGAGCYGGECVPVTKRGASNPEDAWVLTLVLDTVRARSELWVLDGAEFEAPPVARVVLPGATPFGFHGAFYPADTDLPI